MTKPDAINLAVIDSQRGVIDAEEALDSAQRRRTLAFALANEKGKTSGDLARLTGITPMQALYMIRTGHRLIATRRAQRERQAA